MKDDVLLETEGLTRTFGKLAAVNDVSFRVRCGGCKAIIGPNGAGKTTLFNLITGKLSPSAGRVRFKGKDLTGLPPHVTSRRGLARSFQLTNIFPELSAFENVRIAAQARHPKRRALWISTSALGEVEEQALRILKDISLSEHAQELAGELSYGDQRHLEIGLALATEPDLLLLDEPTSGMSPHETHRTIELIQRIAQRVTVLLIEHDMDVVMTVSDSILVMHYGQVLAEGTPQEIEGDERVQEAYLGGFE